MASAIEWDQVTETAESATFENVQERVSDAFEAGATQQRPFERFSDDLFGFLGGGISTAAQAQQAFGRRRGPGRQPKPAGVDPTVLLLAGGAVVLALALRK